MHPSPEATICPSCQTPFAGKYCNVCGEKRLDVHHDFSLKHYAEEAFDVFTHFDTKFFKSFRYLLTKPGRLTNLFLEGQRVKFMKPVQLYILVAIFFFFFFKHWDIFYNKLRFAVLQKSETVYYTPAEQIERPQYALAMKRAAHHHMTLEQYVDYYDNKMADRSKAFIFLIIPMWALVLYALHFNRNRFFVAHLVHATHLFTFMLFLLTVWLFIYQYVIGPFVNGIRADVIFFPVNAGLLVYIFLSMRRVYHERYWVVTLKLLVMAVSIVLFFALYRDILGPLNLYII